MRVSEIPREEDMVVETILELLCADSIAINVEYPIDKATAEFEIQNEETITPDLFREVIAKFVRHIYYASRFPRQLTLLEALGEAIHLLNRYAESDGPDRYGSTLAIVLCRGREELERVVLQLSEIIKDAERRKYRQWVFTRHFRCLPWENRCRIISSYLDSLSPDLIAAFQELQPEQLVECFEDLIQTDLLCRNIYGPVTSRKEERHETP